MGMDQPLVDLAGNEGLQNRPLAGGAECIEPPVVEIGNARREAEPQQVAQREDMVRDPTPISVVDGDVDVGSVIEQAVEDMECLTTGHRDRLGMVGSVPPGEMGVETDRRVASFVWIDGAGRFAASAEWKVLAIRTRGGAGPERRGERLRLLRLHDPRQGAAVGLLPQMPSRRPDQLLVAGDWIITEIDHRLRDISKDYPKRHKQ